MVSILVSPAADRVILPQTSRPDPSHKAVAIPQQSSPTAIASETASANSERARGWRNRNLSLILSVVFHLVVMLMLGILPFPNPPLANLVVLTATEWEPFEPFEIPPEFEVVELPSLEIGSGGLDGSEAMMSLAMETSDTPVIIDEVNFIESPSGDIQLNKAVEVSSALHHSANLKVRGTAGEGVSATEGAIDRLTQEILGSLQERKTAVVWLFDQSGSLLRQREEIHARIDQIYQELGVIEAAANPAFERLEDKPLLTSVYAFGDKVYQLLKKPTDNVEEIKRVIAEIPLDETGVERTFTAVQQAVKQVASMRTPNPETREPDRNVLIVVFTDEVGDDQDKVEETIKLCNRYGMPVFVVGVPAIFGRNTAFVKWVDPDPEYDQTPQWGEVDQGPESVVREHLKVTFGRSREMEQPLDSGFGPFSLTRLCVQTGGVYFAVHPNRNLDRAVSRGQTAEFSAHIEHFFDSEVMRRYRPDYVSATEYERRVKSNKMRAALIATAGNSWVQPMVSPTLRFVKRDDAAFVNSLTEAQKKAARIEPKFRELYDILKEGEADRDLETIPRWRAGYDLAFGRVMALRVRTEGYNASLAMAKRGMRFEDEKNNTWVLEAADEISIGSQAEKMAERARAYLERVVEQHAGTPWALLAQRELAEPLGWRWKEEFTDLAPRRPEAAGSAGAPSAPQDDRARMLPRPKDVRPVPKL